jgi:AcrR family transcriptional regulator
MPGVSVPTMGPMAVPERSPTTTVPRGRHAPPLEVRLTVQRRRLFEAAAAVFARVGYAEASAESISREAGMSKATFYEHFANKEECILALFDEAATEIVRAMATASDADGYDSYEERVTAGVRAFLETLASYPESAQTLLVEIIGAGPRAAARRDAILESFAEALFRDNQRAAPGYGAPTFASRDDAFAIIGAAVELVSRSLRTGHPGDVLALEPVIGRLLLGALDRARP